MGKEKYIVLIDIEATCDEHEGDDIRGENRETVEIGALKLRLDTGGIVGEFESFVRPVKNPILTPFCRELLNITQADVDAAPGFASAASDFFAWAGQDVVAWASYGRFDEYQWQHDCNRHDRSLVMPWEHLNLKKIFASATGMKRRGIGGAFAEMGMDIGEQRHRALIDVKHVYALMREVPSFYNSVRTKAVGLSERSECYFSPSF